MFGAGWELWTQNIPNTVIKTSKRPEECSLADLSFITQNGITVITLPLWWVVRGPTETQEVKIIWKVGYRLFFSFSLWETLTLRYPPAETSILLSGEKQRSVTQPPWVAAPSSTEIGANKWRSSPFETFHIYKNDTQFINRVTQKFYISISFGTYLEIFLKNIITIQWYLRNFFRLHSLLCKFLKTTNYN